MKSIRLRFLIAALAVVLGTALANAQTSADAPPHARCTAPNLAWAATWDFSPVN